MESYEADHSNSASLFSVEDVVVESTLQYASCECKGSSTLNRSFVGRKLASEDDDEGASENEPWKIAYASVVLFLMFAALISDRFGADTIMLATLTAFLVVEIIDVTEGFAGFGNDGLWTVMILFMVVEGVGKTGALDWYMTKLLGHPKSLASAQMRVLIPVTFLSAFINNTPIVVIMIPVIQRWAQHTGQPVQQLMIPLSFASILGGTCTLIGTSTNLVVTGLLKDRYPNDESLTIGLFDLGEYGVPVAFVGIAYILVAAPILLPGGHENIDPYAEADEVLLGARLTQWSPAVNRTVQRSGLRDTGGIYLVSVYRAATGNVHRAVSQDFVLNNGDILYFTGQNVEHFGDFCAENGLEVVTNEVSTAHDQKPIDAADGNAEILPVVSAMTVEDEVTIGAPDAASPGEGPYRDDDDYAMTPNRATPPPLFLDTIPEDDAKVPARVGCTKESLLMADYDELLRTINRMQDIIRNAQTPENKRSTEPDGISISKRGGVPSTSHHVPTVDGLRPNDPPKIVVTVEKDLVVVGINARDRVGLLLDISKGLLRLDFQLHHTEAVVIFERSLSVWRCEIKGTELPDVEQIWSVMSALLSNDTGVEAIKKRGLRVIRAAVTKGSRLIGKTAAELNFRNVYKAAIVAVRQRGANIATADLSKTRFGFNDILILQASDDSPLLIQPPPNFYKELDEILAENQRSAHQQASRQGNGRGGWVNMVLPRRSVSGNASSTISGDIDNDEELAAPGLSIVSNANDGKTSTLGDSLKPWFNNDENNGSLDMGATLTQSNGAEDHQSQQDSVWKDLMVLFKNTSSDAAGANTGSGVATREFLTAMVIAPGSNFASKTVYEAGIHKLPELFLVSIERPRDVIEGHTEANDDYNPNAIDLQCSQLRSNFRSKGSNEDDISNNGGQSVRTEQVTFEAIDPDEPLAEGDVLWFSGSAWAVGSLRKIPGLVQYQSEEVEKINDRVHDRRLVQAVVARHGPLVGHTVRELRFRTKYGAAVIAVHREGKRVMEHPGRIKLQAGDVLLLEAGPSFLGRTTENDRAFALLAEVKDSAPPRLRMLLPALLIAVVMLAVFSSELASILICALVAAILMIALGILSEQEARDSLNWEIYVIIACAFGIGTALENSGVAGGLANVLVDLGEAMGIGDAGILGAVYCGTFLISNVLTNNAAAALMFPIAIDAAEQTGIDIITMCFTVMLGASSCFATPYGYTTNLLVYGPGRYKYMDFVYFGAPMSLVLWVFSTAILVIEQWYLTWAASFLLLLVVSFWRLCGVPSFVDKSKNKPENTAETTTSSTEVLAPALASNAQTLPRNHNLN